MKQKKNRSRFPGFTPMELHANAAVLLAVVLVVTVFMHPNQVHSEESPCAALLHDFLTSKTDYFEGLAANAEDWSEERIRKEVTDSILPAIKAVCGDVQEASPDLELLEESLRRSVPGTVERMINAQSYEFNPEHANQLMVSAREYFEARENTPEMDEKIASIVEGYDVEFQALRDGLHERFSMVSMRIPLSFLPFEAAWDDTSPLSEHRIHAPDKERIVQVGREAMAREYVTALNDAISEEWRNLVRAKQGNIFTEAVMYPLLEVSDPHPQVTADYHAESRLPDGSQLCFHTSPSILLWGVYSRHFHSILGNRPVSAGALGNCGLMEGIYSSDTDEIIEVGIR